MSNPLAAFKLTKIKVAGYGNHRFSGMPFAKMDLQVNPDSITRHYPLGGMGGKGGPQSKGNEFPEVTKYNGKVANSSKTPSVTPRSEPEKVKFKFLLDATGIISGCDDVPKELEKFLKITYYYYGQLHRLPFVMITWGKVFKNRLGENFRCQLSSLDVEYKLFSPGGKPLRAEVSVGFEEYLSPQDIAKMENRSSPDMTHIRTVKPGSNLVLMCLEVYGSSDYYLDVARFNGLSSAFDIQPGQKLYFPPLAK